MSKEYKELEFVAFRLLAKVMQKLHCVEQRIDVVLEDLNVDAVIEQ